MTVGRLIKFGIGALVVAILGWVLTHTVGAFAAQPDTVEDLTAAWTAAGPTPLGESTRLDVPPGQTLVAFLVGTQLVSLAGTTTGSCSATSAGAPVGLSRPVQINPATTGVLREGQEVVAVAGWRNAGPEVATVEITCASADSTVEHFVAVPSRTAALVHPPWFQPWGWVGLGATGILAITLAVVLACSRRA